MLYSGFIVAVESMDIFLLLLKLSNCGERSFDFVASMGSFVLDFFQDEGNFGGEPVRVTAEGEEAVNKSSDSLSKLSVDSRFHEAKDGGEVGQIVLSSDLLIARSTRVARSLD